MAFHFTVEGHRGSGGTDAPSKRVPPGHPPENTRPSFKAAFEKGAGVEADVVRTADNHLVVVHSTLISDHVKNNPFAAEKINPRKIYIDQLTLEEVKQLKTGPEENGTIPTLKEFLEICPQDGRLINLEVKDVQGTDCPRREPPMVSLLSQEIRETGFPLELIRFSSFSLDTLVEFKKLEPKARIGMLFGLSLAEEEEPKRLFADGKETYRSFTRENVEEVLRRIPDLEAFHPEIRTLKLDLLKFAAQGNIKVATWALGERSPIHDRDCGIALRRAVVLCREADIPLTHITDYIDDARQYVASLEPAPVRHRWPRRLANFIARMAYGKE